MIYLKALFRTWQLYAIIFLVATVYLFLRMSEPKHLKVSKPDVDTISFLQGGDIAKGDGK